MRHGSTLLSATLIALVGLAGCGHQQDAAADPSTKPATSAAADGPFGRAHQQEAVQLAARTAGAAMSGRLDLTRPIAAFTTTSPLPTDGGNGGGWIISFPLKLAASTLPPEAAGPGTPSPSALPSSATPPNGPAPVGGVSPNVYHPPLQVTTSPPPTSGDVRPAPANAQPPSSAMPPPPAAQRPGGPGGTMPPNAGPPPPSAMPPGAGGPPLSAMPGSGRPPQGAMPGSAGMPPGPMPGAMPMSPIGCTVFVSVDGHAQVLPPQH